MYFQIQLYVNRRAAIDVRKWRPSFRPESHNQSKCLAFQFQFRCSVALCLSCRAVLCRYITASTESIVCVRLLNVVFCFQMFENIKSLRLETNLNGTIVIKGMLSTEGEFLQFQDEGSYVRYVRPNTHI